MHLRARLSKKFHLKRERKMEWKMRLFYNATGETLVAGPTQKGGGQKRSIKCIKKKKWKEQSVFTFLFLLHSVIYSTMFFQPFSQQTKKERTHKTPIHKIKPIPSLSWANCLLEVCWRFCVDKEIVYFFHCFALLLPHVLQDTIPPFPMLFLVMCYSNSELLFQNIIIKQMDIYIVSPLGKHYFS